MNLNRWALLNQAVPTSEMEELYGKVGDGLVKRRQVFAATLISMKTISLAVS